jgi:hypothetical protein
MILSAGTDMPASVTDTTTRLNSSWQPVPSLPAIAKDERNMTLTVGISSSSKHKAQVLQDDVYEVADDNHSVKKCHVHSKSSSAVGKVDAPANDTTGQPVTIENMQTTTAVASQGRKTLARQHPNHNKHISETNIGHSRCHRGDLPHIQSGSANKVTCKPSSC